MIHDEMRSDGYGQHVRISAFTAARLASDLGLFLGLFLGLHFERILSSALSIGSAYSLLGYAAVLFGDLSSRAYSGHTHWGSDILMLEL
ncbi:hypothetical protein DL98DRAFT_316764 [Cadophora sp. DSE1049]|nr:hypothetical protein DL98DRAFT_316764 [Cadophora sp. DSE1049]